MFNLLERRDSDEELGARENWVKGMNHFVKRRVGSLIEPSMITLVLLTLLALLLVLIMRKLFLIK